MDENTIPAGYRPRKVSSAYSKRAGPFYFKVEDDALWQALRATELHTNSMGVVHGGVLMTLADNMMAGAAYQKLGQRCLTVQMNLQFIAGAKQGDWIEGCGRVLRAGKRIVFCEGEVIVGGKLIAKASGVFKPTPAAEGSAKK